MGENNCIFDAIKVKDLYLIDLNTAYFWSGLGVNGVEIAEKLQEQMVELFLKC